MFFVALLARRTAPGCAFFCGVRREFHHARRGSSVFRQDQMHSLPICATPLRAVLLALALSVRAMSAEPVVLTEEAFPRAARTWLEVQVALARIGFSGGPIDGIRGPQSAAALQAFQRREGIVQALGQQSLDRLVQIRIAGDHGVDLDRLIQAFEEMFACLS